MKLKLTMIHRISKDYNSYGIEPYSIYYTALHYAVKCGNVEIVHLLLAQSGVEVNGCVISIFVHSFSLFLHILNDILIYVY